MEKSSVMGNVGYIREIPSSAFWGAHSGVKEEAPGSSIAPASYTIKKQPYNAEGRKICEEKQIKSMLYGLVI